MKNSLPGPAAGFKPPRLQAAAAVAAAHWLNSSLAHAGITTEPAACSESESVAVGPSGSQAPSAGLRGSDGPPAARLKPSRLDSEPGMALPVAAALSGITVTVIMIMNAVAQCRRA